MSPEKATYRYYFGRPRPRRPALLVRSVTLSSKLGMHASGNGSKCSAQRLEVQCTVTPLLNYSLFIDFIEHFLSVA